MQVKRVPQDQVDQQLAKVDDLRDPPVPVWAYLALDSREVAGELLGWAEDPNGGNDGRRGLVRAVREYAPGFRAEYLGWVRQDRIRRREDG